MILLRDTFVKEGIFGSIRSANDEEICKTLEHSFLRFGGVYRPAFPPGNYLCVKGTHQLTGGQPFQSFEITGIDGHSGIIFHPGNSNDDSKGCVLIGQEIKDRRLLRSRASFCDFMYRFKIVESFVLQVIGG